MVLFWYSDQVHAEAVVVEEAEVLAPEAAVEAESVAEALVDPGSGVEALVDPGSGVGAPAESGVEVTAEGVVEA